MKRMPVTDTSALFALPYALCAEIRAAASDSVVGLSGNWVDVRLGYALLYAPVFDKYLAYQH